MNSKQRAYLKGLANNLNSIFQIGKSGTSDNQIKAISDALEANELIKINVLKNAEDDVNSIASEIASNTNGQIVQVKGNKIILYRESKKKKKIELPK